MRRANVLLGYLVEFIGVPACASIILQRDTNNDNDAFASLTFDHWTILPGDPLDSMIESESRKCMVEIRLRKL